MRYYNWLSNHVADLMLGPLGFESPWPGLIAASILTTAVLLVIFKKFSNQERIRKKKAVAMARVMELLLFQHDLSVSLTACGRILVAQVLYLKELLLPFGIAAVACTLVLIQLACWLEFRPFRPGEPVLLEVRFRGEVPAAGQLVVSSTSDIVHVETGVLRIPTTPEADWRLRAVAPGAGWVEVRAGRDVVRKSVTVGQRLHKVSRVRSQTGFWDALLHPVEEPIDPSAAIRRVEIHYPKRQIYVGSTEVDWLVAFFVLTVLFGLVLKRPMNVEF
ncbi:MAG: hypothetical protein HUU20_20355 [Pirellulales bacterium]|nr:hypothetical protein [Pirellulales bacterium]